MINIKKQDPVADAVKDILQQEALKGNQHKIDKNKNNKIDAHDFKILRGEKPEVKKEEVEQIDELKKTTIKSYIKKKMASLPGKNPKKDQKDLMGAHHRVTGVKPTSEEVEPVEETWEDMKQATKERADKEEKEKGTGKFNKKEMKPGVVQYTKKPVKYEPAQKPKNEEVESVDEREMTPAETAEKERLAKGMKKSLKGFKARYGERAKSVMYATATKQAMKEEEISEGKRPESDTVPFVTGANTTSSPMKKVKEVASAAMNKISKDLKTK